MSKYKQNVGTFVQTNGVSFRVWAPFAEAVGLVGTFTDKEIPLQNEGDGYWHTIVKNAEAGHEYQYVIHKDNKSSFKNDPRARHLTTAAGYAVIVDNSFDWQGDDFSAPLINEQIIYELHIGTFNRPDPAIVGTFKDAIEKLDSLVTLGVNMIEVMPINTMLDDRGWGYAPDFIFAIESLYGGRHGFMEFVRESHKRGMGVIVDVVYNHFGPDENLDLWQFDGWSENNKGGIYFYNDWRGDTPWGSRPDFGRPEVRQYILDNVRMWVDEFHVDGIRVDSTVYLRNVNGRNNDPSGDIPETWPLMREINNVAKKINPLITTIAEDVADNEYITKPVSENGAGFSAQWELGVPNVLRAALHSDNPGEIDLSGICFELTRRYNGDPFQRIGFVDSHDSAANGNSRLNQTVSPDDPTSLFARRQQLIAAGIVLTAPLVPMMLQGQEFMEAGSFNDWENLDWSKYDTFKGIFEAHKHLIALRKNQDGISKGLLGMNINVSHIDNDNKVLVYHRWYNGGPKDDVVVVVNFGNTSHKEYVFGWPRNGEWVVRFHSDWQGYYSETNAVQDKEVVMVSDGGGTIKLPPTCLIVLSQDS